MAGVLLGVLWAVAVVLVVAGVLMVSVPAGLVVAGVLLALWSTAVLGDWP